MTRSSAILVWAAIALSLGACGARGGGNQQTRPLDPGPQISFEHGLTLTSPGSKPRPLHQGDYVTTGDEIRAFVRPKESVFVYIGYCDGNEFALYPPKDQPLLAESQQKTEIGPLTVLEGSRPEVVYVIVSRAEISLANPDLAIAIAQSRQAKGRRAVDGDCAAGPGDGSGSQNPSVTPIAKRLPEIVIEVVRYEFLRRP